MLRLTFAARCTAEIPSGGRTERPPQRPPTQCDEMYERPRKTADTLMILVLFEAAFDQEVTVCDAFRRRHCVQHLIRTIRNFASFAAVRGAARAS